MHFTKIALLIAAPLAVSASVVPRTDGTGGNNNACNTGTISCCNQTYTQTSTLGMVLAGLGVGLGPVDALLATNCSPLNIIGLGGNSCSASPVCCTGVYQTSSATGILGGILQGLLGGISVVNLSCSSIDIL